MALRRLAQENNAASTTSSPRSPDTPSRSSVTGPPPLTPRNRPYVGIYRSPASTPSISSSVPFDWEAARSRRPPPFATPLGKGRKSTGAGSSAPIRKAVVRKKGIIEKITSIPSAIAFEVALFPHNVPLPSPKTSAWLIGGLMHLLHLCVRVSQIRKVPDSDLGWEDMYREGEGSSWMDWTVPVSALLIAGSFLNALYLFTRIKLYHLHQRTDPVSSPNAKFVSAELDIEPLEPPSISSRVRTGAWHAFASFWCFLLGMQPPTTKELPSGKTSRIQQLEIWTPGDLEMILFSVYSPAHTFLWMATGSSNWMLMLFIMGLIGAQLNIATHAFKTLLKDREILAAEVMHEYNEGFVYPRINPIRKDVSVMTHQSEVVNVWED